LLSITNSPTGRDDASKRITCGAKRRAEKKALRPVYLQSYFGGGFGHIGAFVK